MKPKTTFLQYLIVPITAIKRGWNDNTRASLFAYLTMWDMVVYLVWYWVGGYLQFSGASAGDASLDALKISYVNYEILIPLGTSALLLMVISYGMSWLFLHLTPKSAYWKLAQVIYITICMVYYTLVTQYFGENTIINGLNFLGGMVLGLLLLERRVVVWSVVFGIVIFILISLNRKLNWVSFGCLYQQYLWQQSWFWILTYVYFAVAKILLTTVAVYKIVDQMDRQQSKIQELSQRDALTGIYNRRCVYAYLGYVWQYQTSANSLTMIYMDLDHFKRINDNYGHEVGDMTLITITQVVLTSLGERGFFGRMGGEEFVIILPGESLAAGMLIAEELRIAIAEQPIVPTHNPAFHVTSSFGVASLIHAPVRRDFTNQKHQPDATAAYSVQDGELVADSMGAAIPASFKDYMDSNLLDSQVLPADIQHLLRMSNTGLHTAKANGRNRVENGGFMVV